MGYKIENPSDYVLQSKFWGVKRPGINYEAKSWAPIWKSACGTGDRSQDP